MANKYFHSYLMLQNLGDSYLEELPAGLQNAITGYAHGAVMKLGGVTFFVRNPASQWTPTTPPPMGGNNDRLQYWTEVAQYNAPQAPGPQQQAPSPTDTLLGGTQLATVSPYVFVQGQPHLAPQYDGSCTVEEFLTAWELLANDEDFYWPGALQSHKERLEFVAAAIAESSRDRAQLGAIRLLLDETFRNRFGSASMVDTLPMCQGQTYVPHGLRYQIGNQQGTRIVMSSYKCWYRSWRLISGSAALPVDAGQEYQQKIPVGQGLNGAITLLNLRAASLLNPLED